MPRKVWIAIAIELLVFAALLFGAAGTLRWPAAWIYLILFAGLVVPFCLWLARRDPALLEERMSRRSRRGSRCGTGSCCRPSSRCSRSGWC